MIRDIVKSLNKRFSHCLFSWACRVTNEAAHSLVKWAWKSCVFSVVTGPVLVLDCNILGFWFGLDKTMLKEEFRF